MTARLRLIAALAAPAGCAAAYLAAADGAGIVPPCPLRAATGLDCPLCGSTRAVATLFQGRPADAASFNLLLILVLPLIAYGAARAVACGVRGKELPAWRPSGRVVWGLMALAGLFAVVRNLPFGPGPWLAS